QLVVPSGGVAKILLGADGQNIKDISRDASNNIADALGIPTRLHLQVVVEVDTTHRNMSFRKGIFSFVGIMGIAVLLRYTIVPDEDKLVKSMSPELRADYERNKEKRREQHDTIMKQILENAKSDKPIWDVAPPKSESSK
ncbi:assembly factor cbp4, partial [Coemansia asiatica]